MPIYGLGFLIMSAQYQLRFHSAAFTNGRLSYSASLRQTPASLRKLKLAIPSEQVGKDYFTWTRATLQGHIRVSSPRELLRTAALHWSTSISFWQDQPVLYWLSPLHEGISIAIVDTIKTHFWTWSHSHFVRWEYVPFSGFLGPKQALQICNIFHSIRSTPGPDTLTYFL